MTTMEKINNLKDNECIVDILLKEVSVHECGNCGKCTFGYEGITQLGMILKDITEKKGRSADLELMRELGTFMQTQVLCEKGEEIGAAVIAALDQYQSDFEDHIGRKQCRGGVCQKFMTYHILANLCTGCGDCIDECEDDAIIGKKKFVHIIDQGECTQCGKCIDACDEEAIVRAGLVKPKCPKKPIPCKAR